MDYVSYCYGGYVVTNVTITLSHCYSWDLLKYQVMIVVAMLPWNTYLAFSCMGSKCQLLNIILLIFGKYTSGMLRLTQVNLKWVMNKAMVSFTVTQQNVLDK
jgi:hypothetical protein